VLIDWFTVVAQIVNFLILVWLLKRFFYRPILDALDERENRIASKLAAAEAKQREAEAEFYRFRQKNEEFDQRREVLLATVADEARAERKRLMEAAHADADRIRISRNEAEQREYQALHDLIERHTCAEVFAIARKALADLAGTTLEIHMTEAFIRRLHTLSPDEKSQLAVALQAGGVESGHAPAFQASSQAAGQGSPDATAAILVRSALKLPEEQQEKIYVTLREILQEEVLLNFEPEPNLISGIEMIAGGYKVAWSVAGYLTSLEEEVSRLLDAKSVRGEAEETSSATPGSSPSHNSISNRGLEGSEGGQSRDVIENCATGTPGPSRQQQLMQLGTQWRRE
jgi:F-type H+-transporting ATPase subunit b